MRPLSFTPKFGAISPTVKHVTVRDRSREVLRDTTGNEISEKLLHEDQEFPRFNRTDYTGIPCRAVHSDLSRNGTDKFYVCHDQSFSTWTFDSTSDLDGEVNEAIKNARLGLKDNSQTGAQRLSKNEKEWFAARLSTINSKALAKSIKQAACTQALLYGKLVPVQDGDKTGYRFVSNPEAHDKEVLQRNAPALTPGVYPLQSDRLVHKKYGIVLIVSKDGNLHLRPWSARFEPPSVLQESNKIYNDNWMYLEAGIARIN